MPQELPFTNLNSPPTLPLAKSARLRHSRSSQPYGRKVLCLIFTYRRLQVARFNVSLYVNNAFADV
jgi:hypothetical protein